jgi:hypothetical protein
MFWQQHAAGEFFSAAFLIGMNGSKTGTAMRSSRRTEVKLIVCPADMEK